MTPDNDRVLLFLLVVVTAAAGSAGAWALVDVMIAAFRSWRDRRACARESVFSRSGGIRPSKPWPRPDRPR